MLDNFAVIIDYFNDFLASSDVIVPVAIAMLVGALVIFAWRSTEVDTPDEVTGQFTIPGRGTFNVVNTDTQPIRSATLSGSDLRRRTVNQSESSEPSQSEPSSSAAPPPPVHDAGDLSETPVHIRVRFLDESEQSCTYRPSQSLGDFKMRNWTNSDERNRLCLIYAGNPLRDDTVKMSRLGLKEGDTMHGFYKAPTNDSNSSQNFADSANNNGQQRRNEHDDDEFDELARYFLPLAGSLLVMTWFYIFTSPIAVSLSTVMALVFITTIYTGFALYNYRHLIL